MIGIDQLKSIWDILKTAKELIKLKDNSVLKDPEARQKILGGNKDFIIINVEGDFYLANYKNIPTGIKESIKKQFITETKDKQFSFIDNIFYQRIEKFFKGYKVDKKITKFIPFLDEDLRNMLNLSMYVKHLYNSSDPHEAHKTKDDIGQQYGKDGRKLCNLYLQGYIDEMVGYLSILYEDNESEIKKNISQEIRHFVKNSEHIFFIHAGHDEKELIDKIISHITIGRRYIAVHSAGNNTKKAKKILENIEESATEKGYDIKQENLKTKSLCPIFNIYLFLPFKKK